MSIDDDNLVQRLPMNSDSIKFNGWTISYTKSHILKSICTKGKDGCPKDDPERCELCVYEHSLELPHLPDMVFHKNELKLEHIDGAILKFNPMDALKLVENGKQTVQVAYADEWRENRPEQHLEEKFKPFDWTFTTDYQGTLNDKFIVEETNLKLDIFKLMQREKILFYHDLTLFEDELHDNGIASCSVKIRVMPSGYFILLRFFLRVDNVMIKMNDTRFHYEIENNYILKEFTSREAKIEQLKTVPSAFYTLPNEIEKYLPLEIKKRTN